MISSVAVAFILKQQNFRWKSSRGVKLNRTFYIWFHLRIWILGAFPVKTTIEDQNATRRKNVRSAYTHVNIKGQGWRAASISTWFDCSSASFHFLFCYAFTWHFEFTAAYSVRSEKYIVCITCNYSAAVHTVNRPYAPNKEKKKENILLTSFRHEFDLSFDIFTQGKNENFGTFPFLEVGSGSVGFLVILEMISTRTDIH